MKWGILGAAKFAQEWMGPAIHAAVGAELVAVASRSPENVAAFQAFAPQVTAVDGYEALLNNPFIDAVYIPLPHTLHKEWTIKALNAGKHVLAEKPIAMHADDFGELIAARDASNKLAAEAYMIVHHPQWQRVKHLIADGAIGELIHVSAAFSYDNSGDPGNIRNKADTGGGGLRDIGVYTLGCAQFVAGEVLSDISAQIRWQDGFDIFAKTQGRLGQATYDGYVSMRMHPYQAVEFHGSAGLIRLTAPFNPRAYGDAVIEIHQPGQGIRLERFPAADQYKLQVQAFEHSVETGAPYPWTLEQARETQIAIDTILSVATPL